MGNVGTVHARDDALSVIAYQFPTKCCATKAAVMENVNYICSRMDACCRGYPGLDLMIFSEYSTQGWHPEKCVELATTIPGQESKKFAESCRKNKVWGCFSIIETNVDNPKSPFNTAVIIDPSGNIKLKYRAIFVWPKREPWTAGNGDVPVCDGPKGSKLGIIIGYDGTTGEIAGKAGKEGADIVIRMAAYTDPYDYAWPFELQARAWENIMYMVGCNMVGVDLQYSYFGGSMFVNFDGNIITKAGRGEQAVKADLVIPERRKVRDQWTQDYSFEPMV